MKLALKRTLLVLFTLLGLLLMLVAALPFVVNVDKYRPEIVQAANERLNGKLELGQLKLSLWGQLRIEVGGLSVTDRAGDQVLAVREAFFHVPFKSLFSGAPELVFRMRSPKVNVLKNREGRLNVAELAKPSAAEAEAPAAQAQPPAEGRPLKLPAMAARARFTIELREALVTYRDALSGFETQLKNLNVILKDVSLSRPTGIEAWAELDTQVGKKPGEALTLRGPARIAGTAKPELSGGKFERLSLQVKADLDKVEITLPGLFHKEGGAPTNAEVSAWAGDREARVERLVARFLNAEVTASGTVTKSEPGASPLVDFKIASNEIALKPWSGSVPMLKAYELGGHASFSGTAKGPAEKLGYEGILKVEGVSFKAPRLKVAPVVNVTARIATDQVESLTASMKSPGTELQLQGKIVSFSKPRATLQLTSGGIDLDQLVEFPEPGAAAAQAATAPSPQPQGSAPPAESDPDALLEAVRGNELLRNLTANATLNVRALKAQGVTLTELAGLLGFKDLVASVDSLTLKLWGGTAKGNGSADLKPKRPTYRFQAEVAGLELQQAVASRFQLFKNTLLGKAQFGISGEGASFNPPLAKEALKAKGKFKVENATFATIDIGRMATEAINQGIERISGRVPPLKGKKLPGLPGGRSEYEAISSGFTFAAGRFSAPDFQAKAKPGKGIDLKGNIAIGLKDKSLDTNWEIIDTHNLTKARDLSVAVPGVGDVQHILAEGNAPVRFPVHAGCTLSAPCYSYTQVPEFLAKVALANLSRSARGKAQEKLQQEIRKKAESIVPKVPKEKIEDIRKKIFGR
ncbi:MAG: AsmA family protein [Oligoflexia bacterium]|nr:AsmA family protein [Oligoflexia bacterium]